MNDKVASMTSELARHVVQTLGGLVVAWLIWQQVRGRWPWN